MAVRAGVGGAVLSIVAEIMTSKAFGQRSCRSRLKFSRAREDASGGGEYMGAIREMNMLGDVPRNREGSVVRISQVVIRIGRVHCGGRGRSHRGGRGQPSRKRGWVGLSDERRSR